MKNNQKESRDVWPVKYIIYYIAVRGSVPELMT